jgi:hypothetical protein
MNWQPIETAPKDGTLIDLWTPAGRLTDYGWGLDGAECWTHPDGYVADAQPTHWMPLPPPPASYP